MKYREDRNKNPSQLEIRILHSGCLSNTWLLFLFVSLSCAKDPAQECMGYVTPPPFYS